MKKLKKTVASVKQNNERAARHHLIEELFYDFHRSRAQVYRTNFFRGIFFGLGSVLGGTIVVAMIVWVMSLFVDLPGVGDSVREIREVIQNG